MRLLTRLAALFVAAVFFAAPVRAYTPESGIWLNPNELGTAMIIEIQDNLMVLSAYMGDAQGKSTWYTAAGLLGENMVFEGDLAITEGSQCVGCPYLGPPTVHYGAAGHVKIEFDPDDQTKAKLTWGNGRVVQIQRYAFYLRRDQDGATPLAITKMLSEWQWMTDFSAANVPFPFFGDVMVFDAYDFDQTQNQWFFEGCRPENSRVSLCTQAAFDAHGAVGYYDADANLYVVLLKDSPDTLLLYVLRVGTNDAEGEVTLYPKNQDPDDYAAMPTLGFRTSSRSYVEGDNGAPSKTAASATRLGLGPLLARVGERPRKNSATAVSAFDRAALAPIVEQLEARLASGTGARIR